MGVEGVGSTESPMVWGPILPRSGFAAGRWWHVCPGPQSTAEAPLHPLLPHTPIPRRTWTPLCTHEHGPGQQTSVHPHASGKTEKGGPRGSLVLSLAHFSGVGFMGFAGEAGFSLQGGWDGMGRCPAPVLTWPEAPGSETLFPRVGLGGNRTPLTLGDPGAVNPDTLCSL